MISSSSRRKGVGGGIVGTLFGVLMVIVAVVTISAVGLHRHARLMATYRENQVAFGRREAALIRRIEQLSTIDLETGQEHDDGMVFDSLSAVAVPPTPAPTAEEEDPAAASSAGEASAPSLVPRDPFDCYFTEDCEQSNPKPPRRDEHGEKVPLWLAAAERMVVSGGEAISSFANDEDSLRFEMRLLKRGQHKAMRQVEAAATKRGRYSDTKRRSKPTVDGAMATIKAALTEEMLSGGRNDVTCKLGATRKEQFKWLKRQRAGRVIFVVVGHELASDYPKMEKIRAIFVSLRDGGYGRDGHFVFACADPAAMAALCAAGFPAIATSDVVNQKAFAEIHIATTEARLRQVRRRRLLSKTTSGSPLEDAALFESMLVDSTMFATTSAAKEEKETVQGAVGTRSPFERLRESLRFEFAADLSLRGMSSICIDAEAVFFAPRRGPRRARHALAFLDDDDEKAKQTTRGGGVRIATRQSSSRLPCTSSFFAAELGNSSSLLLRRLAKLSKTIRETESYSRAVSSELQLETSARGSISSLAVTCSPRPRFLIGKRDELAAIVLEASPDGNTRRRSLALELGLAREEDAYSLILLRDAAIDTYDLQRDIYKSQKFVRLVIAHLATAALVTQRTLVLPSVHHNEHVHFLWTYLDLQSLEDLGIDYRHTHYLTHATRKPQRPITVTAHRELALVDGGHPKSRHFFQPARASPKGPPPRITPEDILWKVLTIELMAPTYSHKKHDVLAVHFPFLATEFARIQRQDRAALNPAFLLATKLRWCEDGLHPNHDAHKATANSDCYGRGTAVDEQLLR